MDVSDAGPDGATSRGRGGGQREEAGLGSQQGRLLCGRSPGPGPVRLQLAFHLSDLGAICRRGNRVA